MHVQGFLLHTQLFLSVSLITNRVMSSSDSSQTTDSRDERIAYSFRKDRQEEETAQNEVEKQREESFEIAFSEGSLPIFTLPGLKFMKFTSSKIGFKFEPSKIAEHVSKKVVFHCWMKYYKEYSSWHIKRDSFPINYKRRIYQLFYDNNFFLIGDGKLIRVITAIHAILREWTKREQEFRLDKFMRYQNGELEDFELDTDDEELFLTEAQKNELHKKRNVILRRMLPPRKRRQRRVYS